MKPRPSEIIAGIRAILADTIAPELSSDHARSRLSEIRAVLAQVDWDDSAFVLKARASALARSLAEAAPWSPAELPGPPRNESFDAYQQYWEQLGVVAIGVVDRLGAHLDLHPADDTARATYEKLLGAI